MLTFVYGMISLLDDDLTARLIEYIDRTVRSDIISDIVRLLDHNGGKVNEK